MKVQLKFKNQPIEGYLIDENGIIYDLNGNIQHILNYNGRPHFKGKRLHCLVAHSIFGYKERYDIHHKNFDKFDNRSCNLVYITRAEHISIHKSGLVPWNKGKPSPNRGKKHSQETRIKMSDSHKGNTTARGRIWVTNGTVNKFIYPNEIPEGFVRGKLQKNCK